MEAVKLCKSAAGKDPLSWLSWRSSKKIEAWAEENSCSGMAPERELLARMIVVLPVLEMLLKSVAGTSPEMSLLDKSM